MHLSGYRERNIYAASCSVQQNITMRELHFRTNQVIGGEIDAVSYQLQRNGVEMLSFRASFADPHTIRLRDAGGHVQEVTAEHVIIAVGTSTAKDEYIPFDG
jgi:NAD(P) transhydrogenase